jgi:hypothetical protein
MEVNLGDLHPEERQKRWCIQKIGSGLDTVESLCCNDLLEEEKERTVVGSFLTVTDEYSFYFRIK